MSLQSIIDELNKHFEDSKRDYDLDFDILCDGNEVSIKLDAAIALYMARRLVQLSMRDLPGSSITFDESDMVNHADMPVTFMIRE